MGKRAKKGKRKNPQSDPPPLSLSKRDIVMLAISAGVSVSVKYASLSPYALWFPGAMLCVVIGNRAFPIRWSSVLYFCFCLIILAGDLLLINFLRGASIPKTAHFVFSYLNDSPSIPRGIYLTNDLFLVRSNGEVRWVEGGLVVPIRPGQSRCKLHFEVKNDSDVDAEGVLVAAQLPAPLNCNPGNGWGQVRPDDPRGEFQYDVSRQGELLGAVPIREWVAPAGDLYRGLAYGFSPIEVDSVPPFESKSHAVMLVAKAKNTPYSAICFTISFFVTDKPMTPGLGRWIIERDGSTKLILFKQPAPL